MRASSATARGVERHVEIRPHEDARAVNVAEVVRREASRRRPAGARQDRRPDERGEVHEAAE